MAEFTHTGEKEMASRLRKGGSSSRSALAEALRQSALIVLTNAQNLFVPEAEGDLRRSGMVHPVERIGPIYTVIISFGRGDSARYAEAVHEHPSIHDPKSWKKADGPIYFHPEGRGPKYLEKPLFMEADKLSYKVAARVRAAMI